MQTLQAPCAVPGSPTGLPATDQANSAYRLATKKLTNRQAFFVRLVADGKSHTEAYRVAYCKPNLKAPAAAHGAYRIANQPNVRARIDAIHVDLPGPLMTLQQRLEFIVGIILSSHSTRYERLRAVELYTKIAGDGAPELPPWEDQPPTAGMVTNGTNAEQESSLRITVDIFKNAPSRMKAVVPLQQRLASTGITPILATNGNGNGNGNGHH